MKSCIVVSLVVGTIVVMSAIFCSSVSGGVSSPGPMIVEGEVIPAGGELRTLPGIKIPEGVEEVVFHLSGWTKSIENIKIDVLFGTRVPSGILLGNTLVDLTQEGAGGEPGYTEFEYTVPGDFGRTGIFIKVPVVSEMLYDVILRNTGTSDSNPLYLSTWMVE